MNTVTVMDDVVKEISRASLRYGNPTSSHESLGVISEEWDELREAVRQNSREMICKEAVQLAACAIRLAESAQNENHGFLQRSGLI